MNFLTKQFAAVLILPSYAAMAGLTEWESALASGTTPSSSFLAGSAGTAISGHQPQVFDVGALTGARSFEFIVYAGNAGISSALMGLTGSQYLKFEQYPDTGHPGITTPGVQDFDSPVPAPIYRQVHIVFTSDGTDSQLYIDGVPVHTFAGVPLALAGAVGLGALTNPEGSAFSDRLDGHIYGFASYDEELSATEIATHHAAFSTGLTPLSLAAWRNAVATSSLAPSATIFSPVSGLAPITVNLGELTGARTFEFVVLAGETGASEALLGRGGSQALKFRQWQNTDLFGLTEFGVADHLSETPSAYHRPVHIAYVFDGTSTALYVDGAKTHTFENIPLNLTGNAGLGASATITEETGQISYRDPLDGTVFRFASYDEALTPTEVSAHHAAFSADGGAQDFTAWQAAVNAASPATVVLEPATGTTQTTVDVGPLTGARSFEFIVNAGLANGSSALMGGNEQAIKYEQWQDTGMLGITTYGVADHVSMAAAPEFADTHLVFTFDGTDTQLYVDGQLQHTFSGIALSGRGLQGLATAAGLPVFSAAFGDPLDGHILGFASYPGALSDAQLLAHSNALTQSGPANPPVDFRITSLVRNPATGALTLTWNSGDTGSYRIEYSEDPAVFPAVAANNIPAVPGGTTTHTIPAPSGNSRLFFRVVRL